MPSAARPNLEPGRVYRTRELARWGANPTRLAARLVEEGCLSRLGHGIYAHPRSSRFGKVPPTDEAIVHAFLEGAPFVFTGPERWNALQLGATAVFAMPVVYNTKRSGIFSFGGRPFLFRRVAFPSEPSLEWFVIDLFEHAEEAGVDRPTLLSALLNRLAQGDFEGQRLSAMAERYGSRRTQALIGKALAGAHL